MREVIVVGSGPAGTFAAYALRGCDVLMLDVGHRPPSGNRLNGNVYHLRRQRADLFQEMIGSGFESLHNLYRPKISLKLKSPRMSYIVRDWERLSPVKSRTFAGVISLAQGGLANAWGAGAYRFDERDLRGFPIGVGDLDRFYDELTSHIGISGDDDDLTRYFGKTGDLLPPLRMTGIAADLLQSYIRRREEMRIAGIVIGRPRLAVLSRPHRGRSAYTYDNLEFFQPYNPAIYNPVFTLDELLTAGRLEVSNGWLVTRYRECETHVEVFARHAEDGREEVFRAKRLILAAGAVNTARIVLQANEDFETRLPILDNWMTCIPFFRLQRIGMSMDESDSALAQLNVICDGGGDEQVVQGSVYGTTGPLRSDVLFDLPLSVTANLALTKTLAPAMLLLMLFGPGQCESRNYLRLLPDGGLEVEYEARPLDVWENRVIRAFRRLGFFSSSLLSQHPAMGSSLHYAATLPMRSDPGRYQTHSDGRVHGTHRVYVADAASFSALPAKNLTLTIMANAMRIASGIRENLR